MIGTISAILTTFAFLPQVFRVVKTGDTGLIAFGMYLRQLIGIALGLVHDLGIGYLSLSLPIVRPLYK